MTTLDQAVLAYSYGSPLHVVTLAAFVDAWAHYMALLDVFDKLEGAVRAVAEVCGPSRRPQWSQRRGGSGLTDHSLPPNWDNPARQTVQFDRTVPALQGVIGRHTVRIVPDRFESLRLELGIIDGADAAGNWPEDTIAAYQAMAAEMVSGGLRPL